MLYLTTNKILFKLSVSGRWELISARREGQELTSAGAARLPVLLGRGYSLLTQNQTKGNSETAPMGQPKENIRLWAATYLK